MQQAIARCERADEDSSGLALSSPSTRDGSALGLHHCPSKLALLDWREPPDDNSGSACDHITCAGTFASHDHSSTRMLGRARIEPHMASRYPALDKPTEQTSRPTRSERRERRLKQPVLPNKSAGSAWRTWSSRCGCPQRSTWLQAKQVLTMVLPQ